MKTGTFSLVQDIACYSLQLTLSGHFSKLNEWRMRLKHATNVVPLGICNYKNLQYKVISECIMLN